MIELLTAMTILVIIVMIALRIFLQSSTVWNVSSTRARINMLGRAAVDYVSQKYAVTTNPTGVAIGVLGVTTPSATFEPAISPLAVEVHLELNLARTNSVVRAWSGGPDKDSADSGAASVDNINSWN